MSKKYKSWTLTVRPGQGLNDTTEREIINWIKKQDYGAAYIEYVGDNEASRHIHAQIWCDKGIDRKQVNQAMERIMKRTIEECNYMQLKVMRDGTKIAYSNWINDYCAENEDKETPECVFENWPDTPEEYYPSVEEQDATQRRASAVDKRMQNLEELWFEWNVEGEDASTFVVARFLDDMMFNSRKICVPKDQRSRVDLRKSLELYLKRSSDGYGCLNNGELVELAESRMSE